jgi:hypothetical protein
MSLRAKRSNLLFFRAAFSKSSFKIASAVCAPRHDIKFVIYGNFDIIPERKF